MKTVNYSDMKKGAAKAAALLKALANPDRLLILCQLVGEERSAGELCEKSRLSQSAFSQHLAVLRRNKIVTTRKVAHTIYYSLSSDDAARVLELMYEMYCH